jgi:hypothetical protein
MVMRTCSEDIGRLATKRPSVSCNSLFYDIPRYGKLDILTLHLTVRMHSVDDVSSLQFDVMLSIIIITFYIRLCFTAARLQEKKTFSICSLDNPLDFL